MSLTPQEIVSSLGLLPPPLFSADGFLRHRIIAMANQLSAQRPALRYALNVEGTCVPSPRNTRLSRIIGKGKWPSSECCGCVTKRTQSPDMWLNRRPPPTSAHSINGRWRAMALPHASSGARLDLLPSRRYERLRSDRVAGNPARDRSPCSFRQSRQNRITRKQG